MTAVAPGVGKGLTRNGHELPLVTTRMEGQLQYSVGVNVAHLAVGFGRQKRVERVSPGTDDELPYPTFRIRLPFRRLGTEALIVVIVAIQNHVGTTLVKGVPDRSHPGIIAVL